MPVLISTPTLGLAAGACHADPAETQLIVAVEGLKDREGRLRLELCPDDDADFLADDDRLVRDGKTFARVDVRVPPAGPVSLCIRVPAPGRYTLSLVHDRNANRRFDFTIDGVGFAGNPRLGWSRPRAAAARVTAGSGHTPITVVVNYLHGLSMRPGR